MGPDEQMTLAHVARRHYVDGVTLIALADELSISRFRVARLLDKARNTGIVRFEISVPSAIHPQLSQDVRAAFGLHRAIVVESAHGDELPRALGLAGAELLSEILSSSDVLGLTAGRTLTELSRQIGHIPACEVVQLCGVAGPVHSSAVEVIRRISRSAGSEPATLFAPLLVSDPESAQAIRRQPNVAATLHRTRDVTVAVVAIGSWSPPDSQLYENPIVDTGLRQLLAGRRVAADVGPIILDDDGNVVDTLHALTIGIDPTDLRRVPEVIAVAGGPRKHRAVAAALRSQLITSLITDARTARAVLSVAGSR